MVGEMGLSAAVIEAMRELSFAPERNQPESWLSTLRAAAVSTARAIRPPALPADAAIVWAVSLGVAVPLALVLEGPERLAAAGAALGLLCGREIAYRAHRGRQRDADEALARARVEAEEDADARVRAVIRQFQWAVNDLDTLRRRVGQSEIAVAAAEARAARAISATKVGAARAIAAIEARAANRVAVAETRAFEAEEFAKRQGEILRRRAASAEAKRQERALKEARAKAAQLYALLQPDLLAPRDAAPAGAPAKARPGRARSVSPAAEPVPGAIDALAVGTEDVMPAAPSADNTHPEVMLFRTG
jgi:hypothetical protein